MGLSLYDILRRDVKKMVHGIGEKKNGNVHSLIMQEVENYIIALVLEETKYNYFVAAKILGISRSTLYRKIEKFKAEDEKAQEVI